MRFILAFSFSAALALTGCADSALAPDAPAAATQADPAALTPSINGPSSVAEGCYATYSIAGNAAGTWSTHHLGGNLTIHNTSYNTSTGISYATVSGWYEGLASIRWKKDRNSDLIARSVTVTPDTGACVS